MASNRLALVAMGLFFVISREYRHVYDELRATFAESEDVVIILDRRFGDRRREHRGPPDRERRKAERRQPVDHRFASIGWRLVRRSSSP